MEGTIECNCSNRGNYWGEERLVVTPVNHAAPPSSYWSPISYPPHRPDLALQRLMAQSVIVSDTGGQAPSYWPLPLASPPNCWSISGSICAPHPTGERDGTGPDL